MNPNARAVAMVRMAMTAFALSAVGMVIDTILWKTEMGFSPRLHLVTIFVALSSLLVLAGKKRRADEWLATTLFFVNILVCLVAMWSVNMHLAIAGKHWTVFTANKLGALTVAVLAPPRWWVGLLGILMFTLPPIVELSLMEWMTESRFSISEPWATVTFGVFAFGLYAHGFYRRAIERRAALAHARASALDGFARKVVAVQDLMNSPVQTIDLTLTLLREGHIDAASAVPRLERATAQLAALNQELNRQSNDLSHVPRDRFDALAVLAEESWLERVLVRE